MRLGEERYVYDAARFMVFTTDLPVSGRVTEATPERPYLCLRLDFDPEEVAELVARSGPPRAPAASGAPVAAVAPVASTGNAEGDDLGRGLFVSAVTAEMLDASARLMLLLDHPEDQAALAAMAMRELVYRVLRSEQGERLAQVARRQPDAARAPRDPLAEGAFATAAHRVAGQGGAQSASSLHHHFRALTSMSPLQYQKQLRLQEARRLLIAEGLEVARAGHAVRYESPSQFSREYSRLTVRRRHATQRSGATRRPRGSRPRAPPRSGWRPGRRPGRRPMPGRALMLKQFPTIAGASLGRSSVGLMAATCGSS